MADFQNETDLENGLASLYFEAGGPETMNAKDVVNYMNGVAREAGEERRFTTEEAKLGLIVGAEQGLFQIDDETMVAARGERQRRHDLGLEAVYKDYSAGHINRRTFESCLETLGEGARLERAREILGDAAYEFINRK